MPLPSTYLCLLPNLDLSGTTTLERFLIFFARLPCLCYTFGNSSDLNIRDLVLSEVGLSIYVRVFIWRRLDTERCVEDLERRLKLAGGHIEAGSLFALYQPMSRVLTLVKDVTPSTPRPWTVKVTVVDKTSVRDARNSPTKFQHVILADPEDNRVQLTLFGETINMFKDRLQFYGTYYISNAIVKPSLVKYRVGPNLYQWSLHSMCLVEEAEPEEGGLACLSSAFTPIEKLGEYNIADATIDLMVIALQTLPARQILTKNGPAIVKEIVIIDRGLKPVVLTFWDHFVNNEAAEIASIIEQHPIIVANHVKVSAYNGLSVTSKSASSFFINPTIECVVALRAWMFDNLSFVTELSNCLHLESLARAFGQDLTNEITSIASVKSQPHTRLFYIQCCIRVIDFVQDMTRRCCHACRKPTTAEVGATYTCNFCRSKDARCVHGLRLEVLAHDSTGELNAALYDEDVFVFFDCSYNALLRNLTLPTPDPIQSFIKCDDSLVRCLRIKAYENTYMLSTTRKYTGSFPKTQTMPLPVAVSSASYSSEPDFKHLPLHQTLDEATDLELTETETRLLDDLLQRRGLKRKQIPEIIETAPTQDYGSAAAGVPLTQCSSKQFQGNQPNVHGPGDLKTGANKHPTLISCIGLSQHPAASQPATQVVLGPHTNVTVDLIGCSKSPLRAPACSAATKGILSPQTEVPVELITCVESPLHPPTFNNAAKGVKEAHTGVGDVNALPNHSISRETLMQGHASSKYPLGTPLSVVKKEPLDPAYIKDTSKKYTSKQRTVAAQNAVPKTQRQLFTDV